MNDICRATCAYFSREPAISVATRRPDGSDSSIGCCTACPPEQFLISGVIVSTWPETRDHRFCGMYLPRDGDDPDDPGREDIPDDTVVPFERKAA